MAICQYFLKGNCRFGDRCRNEHRRIENRGSSNQGGRNQRYYHHDSRDSGSRYDNFNDGNYNKNHGTSGRYDNRGYNESQNYNQGQRNQRNYQEQQGFHKSYHDSYHGDSGYHNHDRSRAYYGDGYRGGGGQGGRNYNKDKYHYDARDRNRYSLLGHQPDPEPPTFENKPRGRTHSTTSQQSVSLEQKVERVRKDMREWHDSGQWPLSCYAPFADEPCFHGLIDISPEEMRNEAYKAKMSGNSVTYTQSLEQTIEKYKQRKEELATMSTYALQDEMSKSAQSSSTMSGSLFGNLASSAHLFGETSTFGGSTSTTSSMSLQSMPESLSNNTALNPSTTRATLFNPSAKAHISTTINNSSSIFAKSQETSSNDASDAQASTLNTQSPKMTSLKCSEQDLKAFRAEYFQLGSIPECPPPLELC